MLRPQQSTTRELVSLNGLWRFALDNGTRPEPWTSPLDSEIEMPVPSSYNDVRVDLDLRHHVGAVWYQRQVRVPRGWGGERIVLRFDAATHEADVYVDSELVTSHVGGYTPFEVDITQRVRAGEQFRLSVAVRNVLTAATVPPGEVREDADGTRTQTYLHDFFNYAGLARSVWLYSTPAEPIHDISAVASVDGATGILRYQVARDGAASVHARVRDHGGAVVAETTGESGELRIPEVTLWQPGAAYLYDLAIELLDGDRVVDEYVLPVGVRTVEVRGVELLINGAPFYFRGFGKHEDNIARGKGHDDVMMVHDFSLMAWSGANSLRTSHYPYAEEVLDYADRHGLVVIDETAAVGLNLNIGAGMGIPSTRPTFSEQTFGSATRAAHAQHLTELIDRDRHHPSVVMWCITNEPASDEDGAREYFEPLVELAREAGSDSPVDLRQSRIRLEHQGPHRRPLRRHLPESLLRLVQLHGRSRGG